MSSPNPCLQAEHSAGSNGQPVAVTGGGPMAVAGPMFLCARSDLSPNRFYSGRIANLGVYNTSISAPAMAALFHQASGGGAVQTGCNNVTRDAAS